MADHTNAEVSDERLWEASNGLEAVIGWLAELDYPGVGTQMQKVRAAADELDRRSVTSQASEGEAEPFNTGVGWENLSCDDQFALARKIASNVGYVLVAEPLISETEDRAEAMMLREALLDADEHLTGIENYGGEPAVRARRGRASIEAALASASPSKRVERLETAHPDDIAVDRFAAAMKAKLAKKRAEGRSGWQDKFDCAREFLSQLLRGHVEKGDPLDVGNLAMMLHERGETIADAGSIASWVEREADRNMGLPR